MKNEKCRSCLVCKATSPPRLDGDWDGAAWQGAQTLEVAQFRPESSEHRPETQAKLLYDTQGLYVIFRVHDRYVVWVLEEGHVAERRKLRNRLEHVRNLLRIELHLAECLERLRAPEHGLVGFAQAHLVGEDGRLKEV